MSLDQCRVVLIQTHYPGNLGAAARVMCNFGLRDLVLVSPGADRNDANAKQMSTHGEPILNNARIVSDLSDAINDCALVIGTSAKSGGLFRQQNVGTPWALLPRAAEVLKRGQPVALVFGPEPTGLSNEVVSRCHYLIQIPTADEYASLNLAQAVAICVYELHRCWHEAGAGVPISEPLAPFELQEHMFHQLRAALEAIHFVYGDKADTLMHAIRHLLGKAQLSEMEVKLLLGMARQIHWFVENSSR